MKKTVFYGLIAFMTLHSCGEKATNEKTDKTSNETNTKEVSEQVKDVTYTMNGSCDDFIARLDFSSFCFTSKKTPKYRLIQDTASNCQIEFYDDSGHQTVTLTIVFADFEKPMKEGVEPNPELAKTLFKTFYKRKKSQRMAHDDAKEISGLGDDAYIGYNGSKDNKEQYLGGRTGNVSLTFVFEHGKEKAQQSCMSSEEDLIKIGRVVIESLKM